VTAEEWFPFGLIHGRKEQMQEGRIKQRSIVKALRFGDREEELCVEKSAGALKNGRLDLGQ